MNPTPAAGRKKQVFIFMGLPILPEFQESIFGHGDAPVFTALALPDSDFHPVGANLLHLDFETLAQLEPAGIEGQKSCVVTLSFDQPENASDLAGGLDHREFETGMRSDNEQLQRPFAMEGFFP